ncbi:high mobility group B protein 3-like isoform X2 [Cucumis sativus]|uniref:high mobility group B protein 3-like isoform X2 n=1 Tax=Cucumis sativus TaxID=3659 RepID=UPI0002B4D934|nr:high mobility group B protein 3-like isoform X2 [Cucumis sativus]
MRALRNAVVTHKKPNPQKLKQRKAEMKSTKSKKKDQNAPKRPATTFFVFMEEFRKTYKEQFPDAKAGPVVGKVGGEKWKSMSDAEKAPYAEKALKRKAEYEIALEAYKNNLNCPQNHRMPTESQKSTSEVNDDTEQEASSSS